MITPETIALITSVGAFGVACAVVAYDTGKSAGRVQGRAWGIEEQKRHQKKVDEFREATECHLLEVAARSEPAWFNTRAAKDAARIGMTGAEFNACFLANPDPEDVELARLWSASRRVYKLNGDIW